MGERREPLSGWLSYITLGEHQERNKARASSKCKNLPRCPRCPIAGRTGELIQAMSFLYNDTNDLNVL